MVTVNGNLFELLALHIVRRPLADEVLGDLALKVVLQGNNKLCIVERLCFLCVTEKPRFLNYLMKRHLSS